MNQYNIAPYYIILKHIMGEHMGKKGSEKKKKKKQFDPEKYKITPTWESFALAVLPPNASKAQYNDMKVAFIAGAYSSFNIMTAIASFNEDFAVAVLDDLRREIEEKLKEINAIMACRGE